MKASQYLLYERSSSSNIVKALWQCALDFYRVENEIELWKMVVKQNTVLNDVDVLISVERLYYMGKAS